VFSGRVLKKTILKVPLSTPVGEGFRVRAVGPAERSVPRICCSLPLRTACPITLIPPPFSQISCAYFVSTKNLGEGGKKIRHLRSTSHVRVKVKKDNPLSPSRLAVGEGFRVRAVGPAERSVPRICCSLPLRTACPITLIPPPFSQIAFTSFVSESNLGEGGFSSPSI